MRVIYDEIWNELLKVDDNQRKENVELSVISRLSSQVQVNTREFPKNATETPGRTLECQYQLWTVKLSFGQLWVDFVSNKRKILACEETQKKKSQQRTVNNNRVLLDYKNSQKTETENLHQLSPFSVSITASFHNIMSSLNLIFATMLEWI